MCIIKIFIKHLTENRQNYVVFDIISISKLSLIYYNYFLKKLIENIKF